MNPKTVMTLALACGMLATAINAPADGLNTELTPFGAYRFGGSFEVDGSNADYELDDSSSYGLIVNFRHQANTQWEILYSRQQSQAELSETTGGDPFVDVDMHILQVGGTYHGDGDTVRPYVAVTIGGTHIEVRSSGTKSDNFLSGSIGIGLQIRANERLGLRLEARAYSTLMNSDTDLFCRTGPDENVCAIRVDGDALGQIETFAGIVFRF